jgi:hypothetical protein
MTTPIGNGTPPPSLGADDDAMSVLYTMLSQLRSDQVALGTSNVQNDEAEQERERQIQEAALQQAAANQPGAGRGFFSSIGHFFGDVANDVEHGHFGRALSDAGHDVHDAFDSPAFWNDLKIGCTCIAAVSAAVATAVCTYGTGSAAAAVGAAAAITAVSAGATAGVAQSRGDDFAATAADANANATAASDSVTEMQQMTSFMLQAIKQNDKSNQRATATLADAIQTNDQTTVAPATTTVRG